MPIVIDEMVIIWNASGPDVEFGSGSIYFSGVMILILRNPSHEEHAD